MKQGYEVRQRTRLLIYYLHFGHTLCIIIISTSVYFKAKYTVVKYISSFRRPDILNWFSSPQSSSSSSSSSSSYTTIIIIIIIPFGHPSTGRYNIILYTWFNITGYERCIMYYYVYYNVDIAILHYNIIKMMYRCV